MIKAKLFYRIFKAIDDLLFYTFGYFNEHENHITTQDAYFGGKIVNFTHAPSGQHAAMSLPFAIIEGMSPIIEQISMKSKPIGVK